MGGYVGLGMGPLVPAINAGVGANVEDDFLLFLGHCGHL